MSEIKYEIEPIFKIEFFKIECINFDNKKAHIEKILKQFPETAKPNFFSNRNNADFIWELREIFKDEFKLIESKYNSKILLERAWSVTYDKGHYHVPHNHSSQGYTGIIYLQINKDSPKTTYIQPWNNSNDETVLYSPKVKKGDIMIVPQFLMHYTEPNKTYFKKRIISFDFHEL
tara:strand:+ start:96 stop:620 length:525 start_codon:yes stop_codon:yes gene_type:complete